jgi:UV DNA damage repair endonuclease
MNLMILGTNQLNISYLGLPNVKGIEIKKISSYNDIFDLIFSLCEINKAISAKMVCINVNEIELTADFLNDTLEEENPVTSEVINSIVSILKKEDMRISFFVGKDYFLGSQIEEVKKNSVIVINKLSTILDAIGVKYPSIVIRVGSAYGNRKKTMSDFCSRVLLLDKKAKEKLVVMNDEKPSLFSITDLLSGVYYESGIPICFRFLPHQFNDGGLTIREALFLASSTWRVGTKPFFFYSESIEIDSNGKSISPVPANQLTRRIPTFGLDCDIIIESPTRETCYLNYLKSYRALPPIVINKSSKK